MAWKALVACLLAFTVVGCGNQAPPEEPKSQPTKTVEPVKGDQSATASGQELTVNPNGSLAAPGSKLGGK